MASPSPLRTKPDRNHPVVAFDGAITARVHPDPSHPNRAFSLEVLFHLTHNHLLKLGSQKPPLHFHPYQDEYIQVIEGRLYVEIDGVETLLTPTHGEVTVKAWSNHRLYPPPPTADGEKCKFILSGADTPHAFRLDNVFFSNWYGYQNDVFLNGKKYDLIQLLSMFDAGSSYLSWPWWIPFGRYGSMAFSIVVGRWVGGLLGYQPFYREWSVDWESACARMRQSMFQRRFAVDEKDN
ncbi:hypothetical protein BU24DRAFT_481897 [Aaosphaeria arxii CBS 175.79]|uniref:Uncharacterized protein n=1 Tax=Aaosphaeria arxii CBS 175.79 TaxID=1450172 RepID=A0A6A5XNL4_9PLEO|nr:uncharacterized protein BU24DRAFT_481897 [Aaosphaeria arxii CBS 175.79]KAF2014437.1 hypothetical protein BU24DRAFT_481897 [Aaosphaeria arxii CBS 175.79]